MWKWTGILEQGIFKRVKGMDTIFFLEYNNIRSEHCKDITYGHIMVYYRLQKEEPNCTRLTVGGNCIDYPGDVSTPTYDTTTSRILWDLFTPKSKYTCIDIEKNLCTPLTRCKYPRIDISLIPEKIIQQYNLLPLVINGFVYLDICKVMYGLSQVGHLSNIYFPNAWRPKDISNAQIHQAYGNTNCTPYDYPWWWMILA